MPACSSNAPAVERKAIADAARALAEGGLVVYPTETVYGLGADACNAAALERLVALKGREPGKPIAVLVADTGMLQDMVEQIPPPAEVLMRCFWPGPLTIVLRARRAVSPLLTGGSDSIGVRLSSHAIATALVRALGRPVTTPSANPAGMRPPTGLDEARAYFGERVDAYLEGGVLKGEPASTVVDLRGALRVVRAGAISLAEIQQSLRAASLSEAGSGEAV